MFSSSDCDEQGVAMGLVDGGKHGLQVIEKNKFQTDLLSWYRVFSQNIWIVSVYCTFQNGCKWGCYC